MAEIIFATKETIKQPQGGLILLDQKPEDHILGGFGVFTGPAWEAFPDNHWTPFAPVAEMQRNRFGDVYGCVSFSRNSNLEFFNKRKYGEELNISDRLLVVGSGTIPGQGNGVATVAEWGRTHGFVREEECPYGPDMTIEEYYKPLTNELLVQAKKYLNLYEFGYKWLKDNKPTTLLTGLYFSPVQVSVEPYAYNNAGYIINSGQGYTHEVDIFDYEEGKCWWVFDSENLQFIKFDWNYQFSGPMIHNLTKKLMPKLYKQVGHPAIYSLDTETNTLVPFADGAVSGGKFFKTVYGVEDYKQLPIISVETLPYPVASWALTSI